MTLMCIERRLLAFVQQMLVMLIVHMLLIMLLLLMMMMLLMLLLVLKLLQVVGLVEWCHHFFDNYCSKRIRKYLYKQTVN